MQKSTRVIIILGVIPVALELLLLPPTLLSPSWDIEFPWFVIIVGFGLAIVAVGLIKWLLLDWLLGLKF